MKNTISIYERERVMEHFELHPNCLITLYVPASGSWYETFHNKEQYLKRMEAWDNYPLATPSWYELRGNVSSCYQNPTFYASDTEITSSLKKEYEI